MTQPEIQSPYLDTEAAAKYLQLSPRTLEKYRITGEGPIYFKLGAKRAGRCFYTIAELQAWADARRRQSTSAA
jgi:hypothetical protein